MDTLTKVKDLNITDSQLQDILSDITISISGSYLDESIKVFTDPKSLMDCISNDLTYKQLYTLSKLICDDIFPSTSDYSIANIFLFKNYRGFSGGRLSDYLKDYILHHGDEIVFEDQSTLTDHIKATPNIQIDTIINSMIHILTINNGSMEVLVNNIDYDSIPTTKSSSDRRFRLWLSNDLGLLWKYIKKIAAISSFEDILSYNEE